MATRNVCGSYPGANPWTIVDSDEPASALAERLARSAGCAYYSVDGQTYGPFEQGKITLIYFDNARKLYDVAECPADGGAIGSGWQLSTPQEAEEFAREMKSLGFERGCHTAPQF